MPPMLECLESPKHGGQNASCCSAAIRVGALGLHICPSSGSTSVVIMVRRLIWTTTYTKATRGWRINDQVVLGVPGFIFALTISNSRIRLKIESWIPPQPKSGDCTAVLGLEIAGLR